MWNKKNHGGDPTSNKDKKYRNKVRRILNLYNF